MAREPVLASSGILTLLDDLVGGMGADDFLVALPALRQAFEYFPPREREMIALRETNAKLVARVSLLEMVVDTRQRVEAGG